jgi:integrase
MPRRRSRGEGSLYHLKSKNLWVSKITLLDGTRKVKYGKLQKDVRDHHLNALRQVKEGLMPKDDTITVAQFVTNYMETVGKHNLRPKTIESYSSLLKTHIVPGLGKTRLSQLRPDHLQTLYSQKLESGLSKRTVHFIHSLMHKFLDQALKWGMVVRNVANLVEAPSPVRRQLTVWNREEVNKFLNHVKENNPRFFPLYVLAIYGGFREGEVLGIHKNDVSFLKGTVTVNHAVQYLMGKGVVITQPKTD